MSSYFFNTLYSTSLFDLIRIALATLWSTNFRYNHLVLCAPANTHAAAWYVYVSERIWLPLYSFHFREGIRQLLHVNTLLDLCSLIVRPFCPVYIEIYVNFFIPSCTKLLHLCTFHWWHLRHTRFTLFIALCYALSPLLCRSGIDGRCVYSVK